MGLSLGLGFKAPGPLSPMILGKFQLTPHLICSSQDPVMRGPFLSPIYSTGSQGPVRRSCSLRSHGSDRVTGPEVQTLTPSWSLSSRKPSWIAPSQPLLHTHVNTKPKRVFMAPGATHLLAHHRNQLASCHQGKGRWRGGGSDREGHTAARGPRHSSLITQHCSLPSLVWAEPPSLRHTTESLCLLLDRALC